MYLLQNKDDNSELDSEDVEELGKLLADADTATLDRIPRDVVKANVKVMGRVACMKKEVRDKVKEKLAQAVT